MVWGLYVLPTFSMGVVARYGNYQAEDRQTERHPEANKQGRKVRGQVQDSRRAGREPEQRQGG